jgi:predicted PurR-regulated permease PerM
MDDLPPVEPAPKAEMVVSTSTVVKALAVFAGLVLVFIAREALLSILLAIVFVLGLDPPVSALERRGLGRGKAALLVLGGIVVGVFIIVVWAVTPVWDGARQFVADPPKYVEEVEASSFVKELDQHPEALEKLRTALGEAAGDLPETAAGILGTAGSLVSSLFGLVTLGFLTLFGVIAKPALTRAALDLMRPDTAERVDRTLGEVSSTISFALLGNVVISIIAGTIVGVTAWIVDAPSPIVLAVIVGFFDLIPQVGSAIAAAILVTVTLIASGVAPAVILLVVILMYQQVENYLIQPAVMLQAVELSGFATIAVVLLGSALLGVVGAILAVPVAASIKVIAAEATKGRRARMSRLRAAT